MEKLRVIFLPFTAIAAAFVVAYSFLNWLLTAKTGVLHVNEDVANFWLPFALPWIPVLLWLRPRIKALKLGTGRLPFMYLFVGAAAMAAPTVIAQLYVSTAAGALTHLESIAEIDSKPTTKYYAVENPCLDKDHHRVERTAGVTGRNGEFLTFQFFVAVPFCAPSQPGHAPPRTWLGLKYSKSVKSSLLDSEKEAAWRAFAEASWADFVAKDVGAFTYLELIGYNDDRRGFEAAIKKSGDSAGSSRILVPRQGAFEQRNGDRLRWALGSFAIGAAVFFLMLLFPHVEAAEMRRLLDGAPRQSGAEWLAFLVPNRNNYGTLVLVSTNMLVFLSMVFAGLGVASFRGDDLLSWGASFRPLLEGVGLLRLVTSLFVHSGLMHLASNLYGLLIAAMLLEPLVRGWKLLVLYLTTGIVGGIVSAIVHPATVSVGASGAIFGLYGVLFGLVVRRDERVAPMKQFLVTNVLVYVGLNLAIGAVAPMIDNAAHVGGLVAGLLVGIIAHLGRPSRRAPDAKPKADESSSTNASTG